MPVSWAKSLGALALAAGVLGTATAALAMDPPKEMKLYVFSSGALNLDKSIIQNGSSGKVQIPVGFFLIRHPKGDVLFDCGNNDRIITDPDYWGPFVKALDPGRHTSRVKLSDFELDGPYFPGRLKGDRVTLPEEAACPLPVLLLRYAQLRP